MKRTNYARRLSRLIPLLFASFILNSPALAVSYSLTDLGTLGGNYSGAYGINNSGQVVGYSLLTNGNTHAFLYSNGTMSDLGAFEARDINSNGQVTGSGSPSATFYSNGVTAHLGALGGWINYNNQFYSSSYGIGLNDYGQVTGNSTTTTPGNTHAFLYSNGTMSDLGTLGGKYSYGNDINNNGQVVGYSDTAGGLYSKQHAFLYSDGVMSDIGTLGGNSSLANAINDNGQIAGSSSIAGNTGNHAFLYSNSAMSDLGVLGGTTSTAYGINSLGQVVGNSTTTWGGWSAFVYSDGHMQDLNSLISSGGSGFTVDTATDINDLGQIVGYGYANGVSHAFLLTPLATVPVPAAAWLMGSGLLALISVARRKAV